MVVYKWLSYNTEEDYTPTTQNVFFAPGETSAVVDIPIQDDEILEDAELFSATLTSELPNVVVFNNASNAEILIRDNDRKNPSD